MSLRILLFLVAAVTATPVDDSSVLVQNLAQVAKHVDVDDDLKDVDADDEVKHVDADEAAELLPWNKADFEKELEDIEEESKKADRAANAATAAETTALVKQEARNTQQLLMKPLEERNRVKDMKAHILEKLRDEQSGLIDESKGRNVLQRRVALRKLLKMATDLNADTEVVEQYRWAAQYVDNFMAEKSMAQKRIQEHLQKDFDWETAEVVHRVMKDWKMAAAPIIPEAPLRAKNPNCWSNKMGAKEKKQLLTKRMATSDGQPNLRGWCMMQEEVKPGQTDEFPYGAMLRYGSKKSAKYVAHTILNKCLLRGTPESRMESAHKVAEIQKHAGNDNLEASYCFMEGHCHNKALNVSSTLEDAQQVCDMRHGHKAWSTAFVDNFSEARWQQEKLVSKAGGLRDSAVSEHWGQVACAMGSYGCDAVTCQESFCKEEEYIKKFSHLYGKTHAGRLSEA